jgi:hypothetical protein
MVAPHPLNSRSWQKRFRPENYSAATADSVQIDTDVPGLTGYYALRGKCYTLPPGGMRGAGLENASGEFRHGNSGVGISGSNVGIDSPHLLHQSSVRSERRVRGESESDSEVRVSGASRANGGVRATLPVALAIRSRYGWIAGLTKRKPPNGASMIGGRRIGSQVAPRAAATSENATIHSPLLRQQPV